MSTYRKFDKYRQRADFATEIFYGVTGGDLTSTGTGTPVYTPGGLNGAVLGTSAGGTGTSFLQRSNNAATSPATVATLSPRKGFKMHVVAGLIVEGSGITRTDELGITIGAFAANANPVSQNGIGFTFRPSSGDFLSEVVAKVGATETTLNIDARLEEFIHRGHLSAEMYYDGTDRIQFFLGRRRVGAAEVANYDQLEVGEPLFATALSPTLGISNNGGGANSVTMALFGYAAQRAPNFGNA